MNKILSIIIPSYNIETFIGRCIESCENQNLNKDLYEIIVVNDGSTDSSIDIAKEYAEKYNNIIIINQENKGLSGARNSGIKKAIGEYIWFIDGDDFIDMNCLRDIIEYITNNDLDILYIRYKKTKNNHSNSISDKFIPNFNNRIIDGVKFFENAEGDFVMVWRYIFRKELFLINNLSFYEGIIHEDVEFTHRILYYSKKIGKCNNPIYNYYIRDNSIMRSINKEKEFFSIKKIILSIQEFRDEINNSQYKNILNRYLQQIVANYLYFKISNKDFETNDIKEISNILKLKLYKNISLKKYCQFFALSKFPLLYFRLIKIMYK